MIDPRAIYIYLGIFISLLATGLGFPIPEELPILTAGALVGHAAEDVPVPPEFANPGDNSNETNLKRTRTITKITSLLAVSPDADFPSGLPWGGILAWSEYKPPDRIVLRWWIMLPICILGVVVSDGFLYGVGRFWGPRLLETRWMKRMMSDDKRQSIEKNIDQYGVLVLLFARITPAIRSPIFIMAGVMRLSLARFFLADLIYAIPGVTLLFTLAFWFGDQGRDLILGVEGKLKPVLILLVLSGIAGYLIYHFLRHPVATGDPREEMPLLGTQIADKIEQKSQSSFDHRLAPAPEGAKENPAKPTVKEEGKERTG